MKSVRGGFGGPPPGAAAGGGAGWRWSQTDGLVRVSFPVPRAIRKSDVSFSLSDAGQLRLSLRGLAQPLLEGPLWGRVNIPKARQRGHKLTKSGRVAVTLEKADRAAWKQLFKEGIAPIAANYATLTAPPPQKRMLVLYDYDSESPNELTIRENNIISVIAEDPSGWWKGDLNGVQGLFPSNFCQPYEGNEPEELDDDSDEEEAPASQASPLSYSAPAGLPGPSNELLAKLQRRTAVINSAPSSESSPPQRELVHTNTSPLTGLAGRSGQSVRLSRPAPGSPPIAAGASPPIAGRGIARAQSTMGTEEPRPRGNVAAAAAALASTGQVTGGAPAPLNIRASTSAVPAPAATPAAQPTATSPLTSSASGAKKPPPPARSARPPLSASVSETPSPSPEPIASSPVGGVRPRGGALTAFEQQLEQPVPEPEPTPQPAEEPAAPPGTVAMAKVVHYYEASADEELTLHEGDTIYVLVKDDSGWWQGVVNGVTGWFPANFAEEVPFTPSAAVPAESSNLADDADVSDKLSALSSTSARLAVPKRAMGQSNRRKPSRSKRVSTKDPLATSTRGPSPSGGAPSAVSSLLAASPLPATSVRAQLARSSTPFAKPAEVEQEKPAEPAETPAPAFPRKSSAGPVPISKAPEPAIPVAAPAVPAPATSSQASSSAAPSSTPAKWPSQLGDYYAFCADIWSLLEQAAGASSSSAGIALCTTDGITFSSGAAQRPFPLGQCSFPFIQAAAIGQLGVRAVAAQVGCERAPSADILSLNAEKKPHNAQTTSGALKLASQLYAGQDAPSRIAQVLQTFASFAGLPFLSCSMPAYLNFRLSSSKDYALGYWLKSSGGLDGDVVPALEFYFQINSVEASCETLAAMAATLANSGTCPVSRKSVAKSDAADEVTKQLATCCGLGDFSETPTPAVALKASTSGCALLVVPGVMGMAVFVPPESPALAKFCKLLCSKYPSLGTKP